MPTLTQYRSVGSGTRTHPARPGGRRTFSPRRWCSPEWCPHCCGLPYDGVCIAVAGSGAHKDLWLHHESSWLPCTRIRHLGTSVTQQRATDDGAAVGTLQRRTGKPGSVKYDAPYVFYVHAKGKVRSPGAQCECRTLDMTSALPSDWAGSGSRCSAHSKPERSTCILDRGEPTTRLSRNCDRQGTASVRTRWWC